MLTAEQVIAAQKSNLETLFDLTNKAFRCRIKASPEVGTDTCTAHFFTQNGSWNWEQSGDFSFKSADGWVTIGLQTSSGASRGHRCQTALRVVLGVDEACVGGSQNLDRASIPRPSGRGLRDADSPTETSVGEPGDRVVSTVHWAARCDTNHFDRQAVLCPTKG